MPHRLLRYRASWIMIALAAAIQAAGFYWAWKATEKQWHRDQEITDAVNGLLDSTHYGYALIEEDGRVAVWNPALERISGYTSSEIIGKRLDEIMTGQLGLMHAKGLSEAFRRVRSAEDSRDKKADTEAAAESPVIVVSCAMPRKGGGQTIKVRINARIIKGRYGSLMASGHVDPETNIVDRTIEPTPDR